MKLLIFVAIVITVIVFLYYYHPQGNVIDYFSSQKPGSTTSTELNQSTTGIATPFSDLAVAPDGTSPLQNTPPNPPLPQPNPPPSPVGVNPPPVPPPRIPKSARDKIFNMARDREVTILVYNENPIGNVYLSVQSNDKNNIFDFQDDLYRFGIRDYEDVRGSFKMQMDPDGRTIITTSFKIRYIPDY